MQHRKKHKNMELPIPKDTEVPTHPQDTSTAEAPMHPQGASTTAAASFMPALSRATSSNAAKFTATHYDDARDVILQQECLSESITKKITRLSWAATLAGFALLITGVVLKTTKEREFFNHDALFIVNASLASAQLLALLLASAWFARRVFRAHKSGKRWSHRRLRAVQASTAELLLQLANSVLFLAPNAYLLSHLCSWFSPVALWTSFVSWTIWNTLFLLFLVQASNMLPLRGRLAKASGRPDPITLDAPWWVHWPKLSIWATLEGLLLALTIDLVRHPATQPPVLPGQSCRDASYSCGFTTAGHVLSNLVLATTVLYLIVYIFVIFSAFGFFYTLPYNQYRIGNIVLRFQVRSRGLAFSFFIATILMFFYVDYNSCGSFLLSWYGFAPMQLVMTAVAITQAFLAAPKKPEQAAILQVWLQEFAWSEKEISRKRSERASSLPPQSFEGFCMDCEPLFCFETAVKLMYWSFLAYDQGQVPNTPFSPPSALSLFNLRHFDIIWERQLDSKAVIGWNDETATVVVAFRGTASAANVTADLQAWRARHPPAAGSVLLGTAPMVHRGFLKAYTAKGFNQRLLERVQHILNRCQASGAQGDSGSESRPPVKLFITGHSLGGALALLCAFDVAQNSPCAALDVDITCITFGAPRVGNRAWAALYNTAVSNTWQVINSDDVITRAGKFLVLYKHVGHRVLINRRGDLVVRPSFVEFSLRRTPGGSLNDHYLTSYQRAMVAVVVAQFGGKSLGEEKAVRELAEEEGMRMMMERAGVTLSLMERGSLKAMRRTGDAGLRLLKSAAAALFGGMQPSSAQQEQPADVETGAVRVSAVSAEQEGPGDGAPAALSGMGGKEKEEQEQEMLRRGESPSELTRSARERTEMGLRQCRELCGMKEAQQQQQQQEQE